MSTDPRIEAAARALYAQETRESVSPDPWPSWDSEDNAAREIFRTHATVAIEAADNASIITTIEELDALPELIVLIDSDPDVIEKHGNRWRSMNEGGTFYSSTSIQLPARILHGGSDA